MFKSGSFGFKELKERFAKQIPNEKITRWLQYIAEDVLNDARKKG